MIKQVVVIAFVIFSMGIGCASAQTSKTGYIQMDPSGKGFVYEGGAKFIPIGYNQGGLWWRVWADDPNTGREHVHVLGARGTMQELSYCDDRSIPSISEGLTYDEYFSLLENYGVNSERVRLGSIFYRPKIMPMPIDKFNIADDLICGDYEDARNNYKGYQDKQMDGVDLLQNYPNCKWPDFTIENCGAEYSQKIQESHITRAIQAAEEHNVKIKLTFFANSDVDYKKWNYSSYNSENCWYDQPSRCGPLEEAFHFWTDGDWDAPLFSEDTAINHAKIYVQFVMQIWGDSESIWDLELWNEVDCSGVAHIATDEMVNWMDKMADYVKSIDVHERPVSVSSSYKDLSSTTDDFIIKYVKMFESENIDYVQWHNYPRDDSVKVQNFLDDIRRYENKFNKFVFIGEF